MNIQTETEKQIASWFFVLANRPIILGEALFWDCIEEIKSIRAEMFKKQILGLGK